MADKQPKNYSPYQQKIIRNYYRNGAQIGTQRLAELVTEIYLATNAKKVDKLWEQVSNALDKVELGQVRKDHLLKSRDPKLLAEFVKELGDR